MSIKHVLQFSIFFKELMGKEEDYLKHHCNIKQKKINRKQLCVVLHAYIC